MAVATLNRELAALKRAHRLGIEQERIVHAPFIKLLAEHNIRRGFVERALFREIPRTWSTRSMTLPASRTSPWRKREVLTLRWADVNLDTRWITLRRENSKSGDPRMLVLTGDLLALMQGRRAARQYKTKAGVRSGPALPRSPAQRRPQHDEGRSSRPWP